MKEKTKRKILGNWLYAVYRRYRYIRYVKQIRKISQQEQKLEDIQDKIEFRGNLQKQNRIEKRNAKRRMRELKRQEKEEKRALKKAIKEQARVDRVMERQKIKAEKEEFKAEAEKVKQRLKEQQKKEKELLLQQKQKLKSEKLAYKRKRQQLRPYLTKRRFREIRQSFKKFNKEGFIRWKVWFITMAETRSERNLFIKIALNSLALFVLSHLVIFFLGQFFTIITALSFDYETILFYYKIYYNIESSDWTGDAVKILYSIKPITGLILGFISLIIFTSKQNETGKFKMFFLWGFVHGMVLFFGSLLMGTLLNKGFGWVISYLYYKDTGKMIFSILSIFALFITGSSIGRRLLISGNSYFNFIDGRNRKFLMMSQVIIPVFLGTLLISLTKVPIELYYTSNEEVVYEVLKLWMVILVAIPALVAMNTYGEIFFDEAERKPRVNWYYLLITLIALALIYFGLEHGVVFSPQ